MLVFYYKFVFLVWKSELEAYAGCWGLHDILLHKI